LAAVPILELPHPKLRQRARKIRRIDKDVLKIAYGMVDAMREAGGVGLAANQIGVLRRIIVVQLPVQLPEEEQEEEEREMQEEASIYINPEILSREGEREVEEGCLSVPGYRGTITRSLWVSFGALDHSSKIVKLKAEGMLSQVLEHEVDHLNGILYLDHLKSHDDLVKIEPQELDPESPDGAHDAGHDARGVQTGGLEAESEESTATIRVR
jgi:peptide deformylase